MRKLGSTENDGGTLLSVGKLGSTENDGETIVCLACDEVILLIVSDLWMVVCKNEIVNAKYNKHLLL